MPRAGRLEKGAFLATPVFLVLGIAAGVDESGVWAWPLITLFAVALLTGMNLLNLRGAQAGRMPADLGLELPILGASAVICTVLAVVTGYLNFAFIVPIMASTRLLVWWRRPR